MAHLYSTFLSSDSTVSGACEKANNDLKVEGKWCRSWNMSVLDKTEVMIIFFDGKYVEEPVRAYFMKSYWCSENKQVLGITLNNKLSFRDHLQKKIRFWNTLEPRYISSNGCHSGTNFF